MKRLRQTMAFLLAVVLLVSGLPMSSASAEEGRAVGPAILFEEPKDENGKYIGFDENTGVLTMALKVRTSQPDYTAADENTHRFASKGYLAFQVDSSSLYPITATGKPIRPDQTGNIAFVGSGNAGLDSVFQNINDVGDAGKRQQFTYNPDGTQTYTDFETIMYGVAAVGQAKLYSAAETGLLVTDDSSSMLYCYVQYSLDSSQYLTDTDADGYVTVMTLRFQCVSGGSPAHSDKALFNRSIKLPQTQDEIDALLARFYPNADSTRSLALGAAGFTEAAKRRSPGGFRRGDVGLYYYGNTAPAATDWITLPTVTATQTGCPEWDYANDDKRYILEGFNVQLTNTFGEGGEFEIPDGYRFPRYQIPESSEMEDMEADAAAPAYGSWIPKSHTADPANSTAIPLKYKIYTEVSANSDLRPELDTEVDPDAMNTFLRSIQWRFTFVDGTPMDNYLDKITNTGAPYAFSSQTASYEVQEAVLNITDTADPAYKYNGKKVQKVKANYTDGRSETMITPVGVVFDFNEMTQVTDVPLDEEAEGVAAPGYAPQLRITNKAADRDSYLWDTSNIQTQLENGQVWITATYVDASGGMFPMPGGFRVQLYKKDWAAGKITEEKADSLTVTKENGETVPGFSVPIGDKTNDKLANEGIPFEFTICDDYGFLYYRDTDPDTGEPVRLKPTVKIEVDQEALDADPNKEELETALNAKKTKVPFVLEEGDTNGAYNLVYAIGCGVNDVVSGVSYKITAAYEGKEWTKSFYIKKEKDYFNYLSTSIGGNEWQNGVKEITLTVPGIEDEAGRAEVTFLELANQWRIPGPAGDYQIAPEYDIYTGLRDEKGAIQASSVRSKFKVEFIATDKNGEIMNTSEALDLSSLSNGSFTYKSYKMQENASGQNVRVPLEESSIIPDGMEMNLTVRVSTKDANPITLENKYKFTFVHAARVVNKMEFTEDTYSMQVPTVKEEQEDVNEEKTAKTISVNAYDQYNTYYDWTAAQNAIGVGPWQMEVQKAVPAVDGSGRPVLDANGNPTYNLEPLTADMHITQTDAAGQGHNNKLKITHETPACMLLITARFGQGQGKTIQTYMPITRAISKASEVKTFTYTKNPIMPPDNRDLTATNKAQAEIEVINQYGETSARSDYTVKYTAVSPITNPKVHLNGETGEITVDSCAEDLDNLTVRATIYQNGAPVYPPVTKDCTVSIKRGTAKTSAVEIDQTSVDYPDPTKPVDPDEDPSKKQTLTASGKTQYSVSDTDKTPLPVSNVRWVLEEIVLNDGDTDGVIDDSNTVIRRAIINGENEQLTNDIKLVDGEYRDAAGKYIGVGATTGYLNFKATSRQDAPLAITVTATYNSTEGSVTGTEQIRINLGDSRPERVLIEKAVYENKIEVPELGQPDGTRNVAAYVEDQFGFRVASSASDFTWSIGDMVGASLKDGAVHIDNTCPGGYLGIWATYHYTDESGQKKSITNNIDRTIEIHRAGSDPTSIRITALRWNGNTVPWTDRTRNPEFDVNLPGLNATGTAYTQDTFTFRYRVYDQFDKELTGVPVTLSLGSDPYIMAANIENNNKGVGTVTFGCTDGWKTAGAPQATPIQVQAALTDDVSITATMTVDLNRAADVASYAVPACTYFVPSTQAGFESFILIPSPDYVTTNASNGHDGKTWAEYQATVYSQYGTEMTGAKATMRLVDNLTEQDRVFAGASIKSTGDATATMEIGPLMTDRALRVKAEPAGGAKINFRGSSISQAFDRGASYIYGVALGQATDENTNTLVNNNVTEGDMDGWAVAQEDYVPAEEADEAVKTFHFYGRVIDQYMTTIAPSTKYYPLWQFTQDHPGVKFADSNPKDSFGNVIGTYVDDPATGDKYYDVAVEVTKEAMGQGVTQQSIGIKCLIGYEYANNNENPGVYKGTSNTVMPVKTHTFKLQKNPSQPKYLFFGVTDSDGKLKVSVDETGRQTEYWMRPTLEEKSATYKINTVVYDQYGYEYLGATPVKLSLNVGAITNQDAQLEAVYAAGVNPEKDENAKPEKYRITKNGVTMAEFDPATAEITMYTACTLRGLVLTAESDQIRDLTRTIIIPFDTDGPSGEQPTYVTLSPAGEGETANIEIENLEDEITKNYIPVVRNQFGDIYQGSASYPMWKLQIADDEDNYTDCPVDSSGRYIVVGEDEEGNPKPDTEWTAAMDIGEGNKYVSIHVNPQEFHTPIFLRLYCELRQGAADQPLLGLSATLDITVKRAYSGGGVSGGAQGMYTVMYNAGSHGTLKGLQQEVVISGTHPVQVPEIVPDAGWGIKGWITDTGELVEDPGELEIWRDQEFTVLYNDITKYAFLSGYDDNTVKPDKAVTRGEFVKMLVRAINNYDKDKDYSHPFVDVDPKRFYDKYIGYAFSIGVVSGYNDKTFRPEATITRAEAAKMVADAAKLPIDEEETRAISFTDVDPNAWYGPYVKALAKAGIVNGYSDGTFKPNDKITRAEAVRMLVEIMVDSPTKREIDRLRTTGLFPFKDVEATYWAYPYILRAAGAA